MIVGYRVNVLCWGVVGQNTGRDESTFRPWFCCFCSREGWLGLIFFKPNFLTVVWEQPENVWSSSGCISFGSQRKLSSLLCFHTGFTLLSTITLLVKNRSDRRQRAAILGSCMVAISTSFPRLTHLVRKMVVPDLLLVIAGHHFASSNSGFLSIASVLRRSRHRRSGQAPRNQILRRRQGRRIGV